MNHLPIVFGEGDALGLASFARVKVVEESIIETSVILSSDKGSRSLISKHQSIRLECSDKDLRIGRVRRVVEGGLETETSAVIGFQRVGAGSSLAGRCSIGVLDGRNGEAKGMVDGSSLDLSVLENAGEDGESCRIR